MAYYVVGPGGTAAGDAGRHVTQPTGTLAAFGAANYYASMDDAFAATTVPVSADSIIVAKTQNETITSTSNWSIAAGVDSELQIFSVDELALDQQDSGAAIGWSGGLDLRVQGNLTFFGITLNIGNDINVLESTRVLFINCDIVLTGNGDQIFINAQGACAILKNTTITSTFVNANTGVFCINGSFIMDGGAVVTSIDPLQNFIRGGDTGGITMLLNGVDLREVTTNIFGGFGASASDDTCVFEMSNCAINGTVSFVEEDFGQLCQTFEASNCSIGTADAYHQYYFQARGGFLQSNSTIFRSEDTAFFDNSKISLQVEANSAVTRTRPFEFKLPTAFLELSNVSTDTIRIRFVSTSVLTNADLWAEIYCRDGTTLPLYNSFINRVSDILGTGTTHTVDTGSDWRDGGGPLTGYNEYLMDIDTSSNPCADSIPSIKIFIATPSTVNFSPVVEGV